MARGVMANRHTTRAGFHARTASYATRAMPRSATADADGNTVVAGKSTGFGDHAFASGTLARRAKMLEHV